MGCGAFLESGLMEGCGRKNTCDGSVMRPEGLEICPWIASGASPTSCPSGADADFAPDANGAVWGMRALTGAVHATVADKVWVEVPPYMSEETSKLAIDEGRGDTFRGKFQDGEAGGRC